MNRKLVVMLVLALALTLSVVSTAGASSHCNITSLTKYVWDDGVFSITWDTGKVTQLDTLKMYIPVGSRSSYQNNTNGWHEYVLSVGAADLNDRDSFYTGSVSLGLAAGIYGGGELFLSGPSGYFCKAELPAIHILEH